MPPKCVDMMDLGPLLGLRDREGGDIGDLEGITARTAALVQIKVLSDHLMRIDESDPETVKGEWSGQRPRAV